MKTMQGFFCSLKLKKQSKTDCFKHNELYTPYKEIDL